MAQPAFVPQSPPTGRPFYESPQRIRGTWKLDRPGDIASASPSLTSGNFQGPDQGYALLLADRFRSAVKLPADSLLSVEVALKGCVAVALKRASLLGRAPVASDIEVALAIWGFLDDHPAEDLARLRHDHFVGLDHEEHKILDLLARCSESVLASPTAEIHELIEADPLAAFVSG